jgi:hypothetical protein
VQYAHALVAYLDYETRRCSPVNLTEVDRIRPNLHFRGFPDAIRQLAEEGVQGQVLIGGLCRMVSSIGEISAAQTSEKAFEETAFKDGFSTFPVVLASEDKFVEGSA